MASFSQAMAIPRSARRRPIEPGTRMWDDVGLITFSLTSGSAFLLQTMHPAIGTVVAEHSTFRTDAVGRADRSIASVQTWIYGGEEALAEGDRLRAMHTTLNSTGTDGVRYTALESGAWAWVPLTGVFSFTVASKYFARKPYSKQEMEDFYAEGVQLMRNLHVTEKEIPASLAEFQAKFESVLDEKLIAHQTAYDFLDTMRKVPPPLDLPAFLHPLWRLGMIVPGRIQYFVTVGTTPEVARRKLGLKWTTADELALRAFGWGVSRVVPVLPERIRYFPIAYQARKAHRERERLGRMLAHRPM